MFNGVLHFRMLARKGLTKFVLARRRTCDYYSRTPQVRTIDVLLIS